MSKERVNPRLIAKNSSTIHPFLDFNIYIDLQCEDTKPLHISNYLN